MKTTQLAIACLATLTMMIGCRPPSETPVTEIGPTSERQIVPVNQPATEGTRTMNDYTYAQRADYVAIRQAELNEINQQLDQLADRIENASAATKTDATPKLQALREQVAKLNAHLEDAKNASESTWDTVKENVNQGYSDMKVGFDQIRSWLSDKIAP